MSTPSPFTGIDHQVFVVPDLEPAIEFWQKQLGIALQFRTANEEHGVDPGKPRICPHAIQYRIGFRAMWAWDDRSFLSKKPGHNFLFDTSHPVGHINAKPIHIRCFIRHRPGVDGALY